MNARILPTLALSLALLPAAASSAAAAPSVSLDKQRVAHGGSITLTGRGWDSPRAVDRVMYLGLRGPDGQKLHVGNATTSKHGRWTFTYKVKRFIEPGEWRIVARQHRDAGDGAIRKVRRSAAFTVKR